jgi:hypothetical protein
MHGGRGRKTGADRERRGENAGARLYLAVELCDHRGHRRRQVSGGRDDRELGCGLQLERHPELDRGRQREAAHEVWYSPIA